MARKPIAASGYTWILLEQDKDSQLMLRGVKKAQKLTPHNKLRISMAEVKGNELRARE
jgi:hypothetical protein